MYFLHTVEFKILVGIFSVPLGIFAVAYYYWWKYTRQIPKNILRTDEVLRDTIDTAIKNAVENKTLRRDQEFAIVEISAILFRLLKHGGPLFNRNTWEEYHYAKILRQINEIVEEYSLPKLVMSVAIDLVYKAMYEMNKGKTPIFSDIAKFTKELEQSP